MIWVGVAAAGLVVAAVADAVATRLLLRHAQERISARLASPAKVYAGHGLAAFRLLFDVPIDVVITTEDVPVGDGAIPYLRVVLHGVRRLPHDDPEIFATQGGRFRAELDGAAIIDVAALPGVVRDVSVEHGRVRFHLPGGASVPASVTVDDDTIVLAPQGERLGPLKIVRLAIPVQRLPYGARIEDVTCDDDSLSVHGTLAPYPKKDPVSD